MSYQDSDKNLDFKYPDSCYDGFHTNYSNSDSDEPDFEDFEDLSIAESNSKNRQQLNLNSQSHLINGTMKSDKSRNRDKSDKSTQNGVFDKRSTAIIHKWIRQKLFKSIESCISTGKEAQVFEGITDAEEYAVKIYNVSNMTFKDRSQYVLGDYRFTKKAKGSDKMVAQWAEKEFRNLNRIYKTNSAILCPMPIKQKFMVLVMTMVKDENGNAAPRLKDAPIDNDDEWLDAYIQVVAYTRILFQECRLVHGDLSEYNLLYSKGKVWMIDVGQSVENEHPESLFFLRRDCNIINSFFRNKGVRTLSLKQYFELVVEMKFGSHKDDDFYQKIRNAIGNTDYPEKLCEERAFLDCHIPHRLTEVETFLEDYKKLLKNPDAVKDIPYAVVTGMADNLRNIRKTKLEMKKRDREGLKMKREGRLDELEEKSEEVSDKEVCEKENDELSDDETNKVSNKSRPKNEDPESRKQRKKDLKDQQKTRKIEKKNNTIKMKMKTVKGYKKRDIIID